MEEYNDDEDYIDDAEPLVDDDFDFDNDEDDSYLQDDEYMDYGDTSEDDIYEQLSRRKSPYADKFHPAKSFTNNIIENESGGNYRAFNPAGGGEGAVGKYQFRWGLHKDKIRRFAGANISREDFMNNPQLQDDFYNKEWIPKHLDKDVKQLKKLNSGLNNQQLYSLVHFRGKKGAIDYITKEAGDKPESFNMSTSKYMGMQKGGIVPIKTNFTGKEIPNIQLKRPDLVDDKKSKFLDYLENVDYEGLANGISQGIDLADNIGSNLAQGISSGIDVAEQFTSQQIANQQMRKQMQQLYNEENNYNSNTQRINNNPILI